MDLIFLTYQTVWKKRTCKVHLKLDMTSKTVLHAVGVGTICLIVWICTEPSLNGRCGIRWEVGCTCCLIRLADRSCDRMCGNGW